MGRGVLSAWGVAGRSPLETFRERGGEAEKLEMRVLMRLQSRDCWMKESLRDPGVNAICRI